MPRYKITSPDTGRIFYPDATFQSVVNMLDVPDNEVMALYMAEIGTVQEYTLKPAHTQYTLLVEKVEE